MKFKIAGIAALACLSTVADDWYVDVANYSKSGDGKMAPTAFGTIQEAVDAAADGDVIYVAPGIYDKGKTWDGFMYSRVVVTNKALRIESTGSRDNTFIVGCHAASGNFGEDAVRCVFAQDGAGTRIVGFTLKDGGTRVNDGTAAGVGGGIYSFLADSNVYLIDCSVLNCQARGGAALQGGGAIRTLIAGNRIFGQSNGAIVRNGVLVNCIAANNILGGQPGIQDGTVVNCTLFGNGTGSLVGGNSRFRNCLSVQNSRNLADSTTTLRDIRGTVCASRAEYGASEKGTQNFIADAPEHQMLAPAFGDCRPMTGSVASTNGIADIMLDDTIGLSIPENELLFDFYKKPFPSSGVIAAGAVQSLAPEPTSGALAFEEDTVKTFGFVSQYGEPYAYPERYPCQFHLLPTQFVGGGEDGDVFSWWVDSKSSENWRPAEMDGSFCVLPPATVGSTMKVGLILATQSLYVDKRASAGGNGSEDAKFRTIAEATAAVSTAVGSRAVIHVSEETYDVEHEGMRTVQNHNSLVAVTTGVAVCLRGAGKGKTVLLGRADAAGTRPDSPSCGPDAVRCFSADNDIPVIVQGFTLQDGHSASGSSGDSIAKSGGAVYFSNRYCTLSDCLVTNCTAYRAFCNYGNFDRCEIRDCYSYNGGLRSARSVVSCLFTGTPGSGVGPVIYQDNDGEGNPYLRAVCHTSAEGPGQGNSVWAGGTYPTWNSVFETGSGITESTGKHFGNVVWNYKTRPTGSQYAEQEPEFVSSTDLRPFAGSPVFSAGVKPTAETYGDQYCRWATSDLEGRPLSFDETGRPVAGCYQRGVTCVTVATPRLGTIEPSGTIALEDGDFLTLNYTPDPSYVTTRPYFGLAVNGKVVTGGSSCTIEAPAATALPERFEVEALASTNWYVDATRPDDSGDGFTPETAKKTLAGVMAARS